MRKRISEKRLVDVLVCHMRTSSTVKREVRHYEKRIDIVTYCSSDQYLASIEAKCTDWSKALQQAILNLTAVEYSYIAIWEPCVHRVDHKVLDEFGIGLLSVGTKWGDVEKLLDAKRSILINRYVRKAMLQQFISGEVN